MSITARQFTTAHLFVCLSCKMVKFISLMEFDRIKNHLTNQVISRMKGDKLEPSQITVYCPCCKKQRTFEEVGKMKEA